MKSSTRTWLGLALFLPLAAILLATFACLPAPVGDPEASKVDPSLVAAWQGVPETPDEKNSALMLIQPWDARTCLLRYLVQETEEGKPTYKYHTYKAWLTTFGNATYLTAEPFDDLRFGSAASPEDKKLWMVFRIEKDANTIKLRMIKADSDLMKEKTTRPEIEAVLKANPNNETLYADSITFKKLPKDDQLKLEETLKKFGIETLPG
jgi:hypothetical protein